MAATYVQVGNIIKVVAPTGGTTRGTPVLIGNILGIPAATVLVGVSVNIQVAGVFSSTKVSAQAWVQGAPIYWDNAAAKLTNLKAGLYVGVATVAAANPSSVGTVLLSDKGYENGFNVGSSSVPVVDDTAGVAFITGFFDAGAISGDNKGLSIELNATGVLQTFSTAIYGVCKPSVQVRNPVGVQGDLIFGAAGWIQGLGYAIGGYASLPNAVVASTGNFAGCNIEVAAAGSTTDVSGITRASVLRLAVGGDATGIATFETKGAVISLVGFTQAAGVTKMISSTRLAELPAGTIGMRVGVGGGGGGDTMYYVPLVPVAEWN